MSTEKLPPFYVGEKVVCVDTTNDARFDKKISDVLAKGKEYTITGVHRGCCGWLVSVGIASYSANRTCPVCLRVNKTEPQWLFKASRFAPLTSTFQAITFTEILETELTSVN